MAETVVIKGVDGPNPSGWYEVELEDGRKPSTKDEDVAQAAFARRGESAEVVIGEQVKGNFTNLYLNQIDGIGNVKPTRKPSAGRTAKPSTVAASGNDAERQKRISQQWAMGRAVEMKIAGIELTDEVLAELVANRDRLLAGLG